MLRARLLLPFAVVLATSSIACAVLGGDDVGTQEAEHREGDPTFSQYPWLWADDTEEEFKAVQDSDSMWMRPEYLPSDHPMTQRLQFWVDAMDAALRKRAPESLRATPKPRVILKKDSDPNAWVSPMPVVWDVPSELAIDPPAAPPAPDADASAEPGDAGAAPPPPPEPDSTTPLLIGANGIVSSLEGGHVERAHDATSIEQMLKYTNGGFSKCRLALQRDRIVFGKGCIGDESPYAKKSKSFAFRATSKWVTVTTGLLTSMLDEDRIVAVLAHELGHYYRTHLFMPTDVVNYFYDLQRTTTDKPGPDPRFLEQTLKVRDKLRERRGWFGPDFKEENAFMQEQRVGFYTDEQEADEMSLEVLALLGIPPTVGPDSQLLLHKIVEDLGGGGDTGILNWQQCSMLRDRAWKDDDGKLVSVPVGDLGDAHHSFCFRTFNMARELEAHRYKVSAERLRPPGDPWGAVLQRVMNDASPPPPPPPPPVSDAGPEPSDAGAPAPDASASGDGGG